MDKQQIKQRIAKLKKLINYHRYLYHVLDKQEMSDASLDSLKHELNQLEQQYPDLISLDSPTQRIGGQALDKFKKIKHQKRMLSLNDVFSNEDIKAWCCDLTRLQIRSNIAIRNFFGLIRFLFG